MALDPRKRQKQLAKQRARRKAKAGVQKRSRQGGSSWLSAFAGLEFELATHAPVYECYVADEVFGSDQGIGQVVVSRLSGNGQVAAGVFLIDAYCLGVKDAFAFLRSRVDFEDLLLPGIGQTVTLRRVEPAYAKKLIVDAIAYARDLGFEPHKDYKLASKVLHDIDATACTTEFTFGKDGKPFFVSGPNDTEARSKQIIDTLRRRCGPDGYHFMMALDPSGGLKVTNQFGGGWNDDDGEDEGEDDDDLEDDEEDEKRR